MTLRTMLVALCLAAAASLPAWAASAPKVSVDSVDALSVPDRPFDETANADKAIDAAFAQASHERKRVLIDLGGNWCADCRILSAVMALPEMRSFLNAHYVVVKVDVGRFDRNLQVPARFGITERLEGVPSILIATPDGKLVDQGHIAALDDARAMTPQAIADWLASWTK
ncbi:MAG TPA: thioredoxin family protein [Rhizomicrobium sp.]|nr:thioredoxin family protein [Rhizomicrobium sp.]